MASEKITESLNKLFQNATDTIAELPKRFSSEDFRKKLTQRNQVAYIELLEACKTYSNPFSEAHKNISSRLSELGFKKDGHKTQPDTFGTKQQYDVFEKV